MNLVIGLGILIITLALGWKGAEWAGMWAGLAMGLLGWGLWQYHQMQRLLHALADGKPLPQHGLWGDWRWLADLIMHQQRQHQHQQLELTQKLDDFIEGVFQLPIGLMLLDEAYKIEWCNHAACAQLEIDAQRDAGQYVVNLVRSSAFIEWLPSTSHQSQSIQIQRLILHQDYPDTLRLQKVALRYHKTMLLIENLTQAHQTEDMKRRFIANASHELKTPLTIIHGFAETLQLTHLPLEKQRYYVEKIIHHTHQMDSLIQDFLTLARLESLPPPPTSHWHDMATLWQSCWNEAMDYANSKELPHASIQLELGTGAFEISGDEDEIRSMLLNLLINALRYGRSEHGIITITSSLDSDRQTLIWSVMDQGVGIAPEHLQHLTERFYRIDESRSRRSGGTGLGLAIVKHVATRHDATLHIESTVGQGSCFRIMWPSHRWRIKVPNKKH